MSTAVAYRNRDPHFSVLQIPRWRANLYQFLSVEVWGNLPSSWQRALSKRYTSIYDQPFSKKWISPYISYYYSNKNYLDGFKPPHGKDDYENFQDFFIREFKYMPENNSDWVWPCEGLLCDAGIVGRKSNSSVKGDRRNLDTIFGLTENSLPGSYYFSNVFLHNKNYHRIHAPISGTITHIQHIPGDLVILRPWIYVSDPSLPAFRNERINIDIEDVQGQTWYLSIVGGPAVGTIEIPASIVVGATVGKLQELALFYLGSTCCMAAPFPPRHHKKNAFVDIGTSY
ncbi:MAG: phosphatidylserine decarboxylase [Flavobacteriaceae bacterium]|nr:phosphatidylserine decarboxylase [Flavobacteriaceae bacterium]